ncbi:MAG: cadherin repeat domain-containing protein [Burkholderiales bacterium]|nr:cadherin repeat domain-containing protein [Burkholderiales bacterium]
MTWTYSTTTDLVSLTSNGSFTGLSVKGTSTNGTFSVAYTDKPLEFFVTNSEPGTFRAANRDFGDARFITPDSDDTVTIVDSSNTSISDDVVLAASFTNNLPVNKVQTDDSGAPIVLTTILSLGLQGTDSSSGLVPGVDVIAELGRPTITGDSNTPPFFVDGEGALENTRVRTISENSLTPIELNFRDFEENAITLQFKNQDTSQPDPFDILDGDLFTITANPTCDSGPGSTCFLITPRVPLDFENPISTARQNRYSLFFEVRSLGFDQTFITHIDLQDVVNETPLVPDTSFFGGTLSNFSDNVIRIAESWDVAKTTLPPVGVYNWDYDTSSLNQNCNGSQCVGYSNIKAQYNAAFDTVTFHATGTFSNISSLGTSVSGTFDVVFDHKTLNQFAQDFPDGPGAFFFTSNSDGFGGIRVETDPDPDICDAITDSCVDLSVRDTVSVKDASNNDVSNSVALALGFNFSVPPSGTGRLLIPRLGVKGADENGDFQLGDNISPDNSTFISLGAPTTIRERAVNFANGTTTPANIITTENTPSVTVATEANIHPLTFSFDARSTGADSEDNDLFTINAATGELTFKTPPDFENPTDKDGNNLYHARIKVSDGLDSTFATQIIQVTDVNAPNANIFTSDVRAFTASVDTVVDTWEAYFALVGDGILTWDPDLSGISQVCSGSQCLDVNRFFVSYNTNTQSATLQSTGTFTNVPVAGTDTSGTYSVTFSDRAAADLVSIQNPSTFAFSTKNLGASNVLLPDSDDVVSILSNASADVSASVTIQASTHANDPTSGSFTATQVGTVSVSGTAANASSTAAVTNAIELGQPNVGTSVVNP